MSEPLRGCYVGSYNLQGDCVSLQLADGQEGTRPQWVYVSVIFVCSLLARPAQGAATTVDIRCLSSRRDARSSVHTRPSPVVVDIRCLSSIEININGVYFNITIIFSIFAYNKV